MQQVRKRITYANVMSSIAVFLVLGGGAAFAALGKNTVGTRQLKKNAVKVGKIGPQAVKAGKLAKNAVSTNRIRNNAVSASKVAAASILTDKIAPSAVTGSRLADNAVSGSKVGTGAIDARQLGGISTRTNRVTIPDEGSRSVSVDCQGGEQVIGAGTGWDANGPARYTSYVHTSGNGAIARGEQFTGSAQTFVVGAYCLSG